MRAIRPRCCSKSHRCSTNTGDGLLRQQLGGRLQRAPLQGLQLFNQLLEGGLLRALRGLLLCLRLWPLAMVIGQLLLPLLLCLRLMGMIGQLRRPLLLLF